MKMGLLVVGLSLAISLASCGQPRYSTPAGEPCERVEGTWAWVNDHRVNGLCVGMYVGQLEKTEDGACRGTSGSGSKGSITTAIHIDENCRVYVSEVKP
jgi:hypothetical protein